MKIVAYVFQVKQEGCHSLTNAIGTTTHYTHHSASCSPSFVEFFVVTGVVQREGKKSERENRTVANVKRERERERERERDRQRESRAGKDLFPSMGRTQ